MRLWKIVVHPRLTAREILEDPRSLHKAGAFVLSFGFVVSLLFLNSHLAGDYPPPPTDQEVWTETWSEFAMLPFVKIAPERYRLAQAIFFVPLALACWVLMAGSARLLSALWGGGVRYTQYLGLFGFSFFGFWALGSFFDVLYTLTIGDLVVPALRNEYGPLVRALVAGFPPAMWTAVLSLGGIYNGIVIHATERLSSARVALIATATLLWPYTLMALLIR